MLNFLKIFIMDTLYTNFGDILYMKERWCEKMRRNVMAAFALSLSIVGTVISITGIVLAACGLAGSKRLYRH